jgi:hypothetical protein
MPSGSVKCFRKSFHNWSFYMSGTKYGLLGSTFHSLYLMDMLPLTMVPHWDTNLSLIFWSTWLAKLWYFRDMIHHITDDYLCKDLSLSFSSSIQKPTSCIFIIYLCKN